MICILAIVMLIANFYLVFTADKCANKERFYATLSPELISRYESIIQERREIYMKGFGVGLMLSAVAMYMCKARKPMHMGCMAGAITLITTYFFYIIHPKSDYMILHLNHEKQRNAWLNIYRDMQYKYHIGLVLGILSVMIGGYSICC